MEDNEDEPFYEDEKKNILSAIEARTNFQLRKEEWKDRTTLKLGYIEYEYFDHEYKQWENFAIDLILEI